ncbi:MAG: hypothetical protein HY286_20135 [Planctomycetes bacterium]|nr:hypothetical protein [Planctomycetota bacterium]
MFPVRIVKFLAALAVALAPQNAADARTPIRTLRFNQLGEARLSDYTIVSAVPFAPGEIRDIAQLTADAPAEFAALERHPDGSVKFARILTLPKWKAKKGAVVELYRGGAAAPFPEADWKEPPPLVLHLTDPSGIERRARLANYRVIEDNKLRQVLRADAAHVLTASAPHVLAGEAPGPAAVFMSCTAFVERFPRQNFFVISLLLRNDAPAATVPRAVGPVRFESYRLEVDVPGARVAVAWAAQNECKIIEREGAPAEIWLLPKDLKNLWLGDGQTKHWRLAVDLSAENGRFQALQVAIEHPLLPGLAPSEVIAARAYGDFGDVASGPPPASAAKQAAAERDHTKKSREYGWCGPWGDIKDTHQTGSPRNGLCGEGVLRTIQTGFREWFDGTWEKAAQHALRPILRDVRAAEHPNLLLFEGVPHPKWKDQLGRDAGFDPRFDAFREGTSGGYRQETHGWNGFDHEHFSVDDLYSLYLFTGDPWLRFELESVGQALLTYDCARKPATTHSARGDGWVLRGFCNLYKVLGDKNYLDAARNLVLGMDAERSKGDMKFLHDNGPDPRHMTNHPFEMPWQVAIAIDGLAVYYEITRDELAKTIAIDLADFLVKDAWNAADGTFKRAVATDGSGAFVNETDKTGTQSWIASALVAAHRLQPKPEYMILADGIYRNVKSSNATFEKGGIQWTWWQSYLRYTHDRESPARK